MYLLNKMWNIVTMQESKPFSNEEVRFARQEELKSLRKFEKELIKLGFRGERVRDKGISANYHRGPLFASLQLTKTPRFSGSRGGELKYDVKYQFKLRDKQKEETITSGTNFDHFPISNITHEILNYQH